MPRIVTTKTKVFTFAELSKEEKEKACEEYRYINVEHDWWDNVYRNFQQEIKARGFYIDKIYFTGFHSQGDGACFEGEMLDLKAFLKSFGINIKNKNILKNYKLFTECGITIITKQSGHYCHEGCMDIEIDSDSNFKGILQKNVNAFCDFIKSTLRDEARELYKQLNDSYNYLTSDDSIADTLIANEYEFTKDGKIF